MRDAVLAALLVVVEKLIEADHREEVVDLLDAALMYAKAHEIDVGEIGPLAAVVFEDRSTDGLAQSTDSN